MSTAKPTAISKKSNGTPVKNSHLGLPDLLSDVYESQRNKSKGQKKNCSLQQMNQNGLVFINNEHQNSKGSGIKLDKNTSGKLQKNMPMKTCLTTSDILAKCEETDASKVFEIILRGEKLTVVPDLKLFKRVRVLDLSSNKLTTLGGLDTKDLRELKVYDNFLTHLIGIEGLKELNILQAQHNKITQIGKGLHLIKKLKILRLDGNCLTKVDIRDVSVCTSLTSLDISYNCIQSIAFLPSLAHIEELVASNNQIKDIPDLSRCQKLTELKLGCNCIVNALGLKGCKLLTLELDNNMIESVRSIGQIENLESLNLSGNRLQNIDTLHKIFPNLDVLDLSRNNLCNIEDILSELVQLYDLRELNLSDNPFPTPDPDVKPFPVSQMLRLIPELEVFDSMIVRRITVPIQPGGTPLMRPMTASTVISIRAIENQMLSLSNTLEPFDRKGKSCYNNIRTMLNRLPSEPTKSLGDIYNGAGNDSVSEVNIDLNEGLANCDESIEVSSQAGQLTSRNRIRLNNALEFANKHFSEVDN